MGNSEVGHFTIGTGRIVKQSLYRIDHDIETGRFFENTAFLKTFQHLKKSQGKLHMMGILGNGAVHGTSEHMNALLELCKKEKVKEVCIHFFLDGRDAPKDSAIEFLKEVQKKLKKYKNAKIASFGGRFYGMDRNNNWKRVKLAYDAIISGEAEIQVATKEIQKYIESQYQQEIYDEHIKPVVVTEKEEPVGRVEDGDAFIFYNFRPDRARQITAAITQKEFDGFERKKVVNNQFFVGFAKYADSLTEMTVAFERELVKNYLAEVLSNSGLTQLHAAETEKYAHVTYFFNGMREAEHEGEERALVPSPVVQSFADLPQMSAHELTEQFVETLEKQQHDFYVMNYANPDMVGHTGNLEATIEAIKVIDQKLKIVVEAALQKNMVVMITADHGNAEEVIKMLSGETDKEHSTTPVPFMVIDEDLKNKAEGTNLQEQYLLPVTGVLADVAPTILSYYNLEPGDGMTGVNILDSMIL